MHKHEKKHRHDKIRNAKSVTLRIKIDSPSDGKTLRNNFQEEIPFTHDKRVWEWEEERRG